MLLQRCSFLITEWHYFYNPTDSETISKLKSAIQRKIWWASRQTNWRTNCVRRLWGHSDTQGKKQKKLSTILISNFNWIYVLRLNRTWVIISYDLEHWGVIESEHSRLAKQTLSNWWFYSVQISSMDAKTSFLYGSFGKCSYKAFDTQVARVAGFNHLCLPSHPRNDEDGDHKNWWREGWASPRGNTIVWIYINKRITLLIFLYGWHI